MSFGSDHAACARHGMFLKRLKTMVNLEARGIVNDLGTLFLAGFVLAGLVIVASTFDGDLQGKNEIIAAILGTLSLFAILAALELADRIRVKRNRSR